MLRLPRFQLVEPATWTEAATLLREHGAAASDVARGTPNVPVMLVAGGTDLFPNMKRRQFTPQVLVSLGRVKGARDISNGMGMRIAAGTTLTEIAAHQTVRAKYTALAEAAGAVSTPQLRNMGTIGGNLCLDTRCNWYDQSLFWRTAEGYCMKTHPAVVCRVAPSSPRCLAVASADTVPALIALGAKVSVENAEGRRELDLAELYREDGIGYLAIGRDDVVVSVSLPDATGWRSTYLKLRDRNSFDFPIAGVAAAVRLDGRTVTDARIAITALASRPVAVDAKVLVGTKLDDEAIAAAADAVHKTARPMDNTSGTISQRKRAARVFTERALRSLRDA
ncbi:MAG TPA: FAD binding domain-containing protein [Candidatus Limnocylindria bacterium]|jgi:4-hydroxybenzoyl-CoA reductase subunit beta|nr:FAD binding domain-containing protein [Candidatus Limnocylindria bacterium]